jgi:YD repeat-containing protein
VDANGNRTSWDRDVQGRVTREIRANGSDTDYVYEAKTSRVASVTDAKNQTTSYSYAADGQLLGIAFTNAAIATAPVSFTYDAVYGRVATMVDGIGTTTYGYHAVTTPPALGAGQLASVDGPLTDDTITYTYDELGRVTTRAINGSANTVTWGFDALAASPQKRTCWGRSATRMTERRRAWRP